MSYVCEKSVGPEKTCDFRSGKVILQQEISAEQMGKLLTQDRTDLLDGFVSSRTNRKFKAYLKRQPDGKVGFEFEPRPEKPGARKTAGSAAPAKKASKTATKTAAKKAPAKKAAAKKAAAKTTGTAAATKTAVKKTAVKKAATKKVAGKTAGSDEAA